MTIICVKDGVMAADSASFNGSVIIDHGQKKIVRSRDGAIGAACGVCGATRQFRTKFLYSDACVRQADGWIGFDKDSGFEGVWIEPNGEVWLVGFDGLPHHAANVITSGSAWEMGLGAMYAGATAEDAVRICIAHHCDAAGEVQTEKLFR